MKFFHNIFRAWRHETYLVFTDIGVLLFFFFLPLAYPIVYTLIYNPEIVTEIPTVVVDRSRTAESRQLARALDATQSIHITGYAADMPEARRALAQKEAYGIIEIPADYARNIGTGRPTTMSFYCDMSLLIRYRQYLLALTDVRMDQTMTITAQRVSQGGLPATTVSGLPVDQHAFFMGDPTQGFASFIIPGIVVLILQQSLLLGICMASGTAADRRRRNNGRDPLACHTPAVATVLGKALCHTMIFLPLAYYILTFIPHMFRLPQQAHVAQYMPMMLLMILATSFLGQTLRIFVRERETSLLVLVFTSVVFLFLSGLTWPRYAFSPFWKAVSDFIPATWGLEGFIHMNGNGATLADTASSCIPLALLALLYFLTALALRKALAPRALRSTTNRCPADTRAD
ncbi:MAG: ABC transporter permease [Muribaculaceae bacterium]|nr:ABC transporter permease [Muribaculaceae bacterium]